jgi:histidinol phosphatase-like PHP family hydrolase
VFIRVAVPVPTLDLLTYCVPPDMPAPVVGARVVVPVAGRLLTGIVVETDAARDPALDGKQLKSIREVLDAEPFVPQDVVALARWTAEYYAGGAGAAITAVLPPKARGPRADAHKTIRVVSITAAGLEAIGVDSDPRRVALHLSAKQRSALEMLCGVPAGIRAPQLAANGIAADTIARLKRHGLVSIRHDRIDRDPFESSFDAPAINGLRQLTPEQQDALSRRFRMSEADMTARIINALDDPRLTILGHPTGRLLLAREPYAVDMNAVIEKAAESGVAIELNADPHRLDLDWRHCRHAKELGVPIEIGPDAHSTGGLDNVAIGVGIARKGWLERDDILNARAADEVVAFANARRERAGIRRAARPRVGGAQRPTDDDIPF